MYCKLLRSNADFISDLSLALNLFLFFSSISDKNFKNTSQYKST